MIINLPGVGRVIVRHNSPRCQPGRNLSGRPWTILSIDDNWPPYVVGFDWNTLAYGTRSYRYWPNPDPAQAALMVIALYNFGFYPGTALTGGELFNGLIVGSLFGINGVRLPPISS